MSIAKSAAKIAWQCVKPARRITTLRREECTYLNTHSQSTYKTEQERLSVKDLTYRMRLCIVAVDAPFATSDRAIEKANHTDIRHRCLNEFLLLINGSGEPIASSILQNVSYHMAACSLILYATSSIAHSSELIGFERRT